MNIQISGQNPANVDHVDVGEMLFLDGELVVNFVEGFLPQPNMQFRIIDLQSQLPSLGQFDGLPEGAMVGSFASTDLYITCEGGDGNDVVLYTELTALSGDVNLDGQVDLLDVGPFIDRLTMGPCQVEADINLDGQVNLLDVQPFIDLLIGI